MRSYVSPISGRPDRVDAADWLFVVDYLGVTVEQRCSKCDRRPSVNDYRCATGNNNDTGHNN
jgi:hypothetical protein